MLAYGGKILLSLVQEAAWIRFLLDFATSWRRYVDVNIQQRDVIFLRRYSAGSEGKRGIRPTGRLHDRNSTSFMTFKKYIGVVMSRGFKPQVFLEGRISP
jgi:hypothetical protein